MPRLVLPTASELASGARVGPALFPSSHSLALPKALRRLLRRAPADSVNLRAPALLAPALSSLSLVVPQAPREMAAPSGNDKWSAQRYNSNASFVYSSAFTSPTVNLLAPRPGVRPFLLLLTPTSPSEADPRPRVT